jgi:iron complex transport system substrate-binding protein
MVDMLDRLGAGELIVGVSAFARASPAARGKAVVSGFTTFRYDTIESLRPDLVLGFSDLQANALCELAKRGYAVLLSNQRTFEEMFDTLAMIGRVIGKAEEADALTRDLRGRLYAARQANRCCQPLPKVYFEEWDDPLITGIAWVGELIGAAGGDDVFSERGCMRNAAQRIVQSHEVIERAPDIIIASWCGKRADLEAIRARPGWSTIPAVEQSHVYEIESDYCLQPGPILITEALPRFEAIVANWRTGSHKPQSSKPA